MAGCCKNVIVASVKQSKVKKQERAVLYLADYPHASSRLQGKKADSLNRQGQAEHRPLPETHTDLTHPCQHLQAQHILSLFSISLSHTHTQAFKQGDKGIEDFQTHQFENAV